MADGTSRIRRGDEPILLYSGVSSWADHMVVPEACCVPIDVAVPYEVAAVIGCAVATGVGAAMHRSEIGPGDMWHAPAHVPHGGEVLGREPVVFVDVYAPPSKRIVEHVERLRGSSG